MSTVISQAGHSPAMELEPILVPGRNCWRIEPCESAAVVVDAADYYHLIHTAMMAARNCILVIGWDFDTRVDLEPNDGPSGQTLGEFFLDLAKQDPNRRIAILKWSFGAKRQFLKPKAAWMLWKWQRSGVIDFRFDSAHPAGCSHHQKIVVIDNWLAVCGGIDISTARWDTTQHLDDDPRRLLPDGKPYPPWHDVTMMLAGPVAAALGELGRERWKRATNSELGEIKANCDHLWPDELAVQFKNIAVGITRTRAEYGDASEIREVEALYLDMIGAAKRFVYIENQYFTSAKLAGAIAKRMQEEDPPEIVLVMPRSADGWLEQMAMDAARVNLTREIGKVDRLKRFRIYVPVTQGGTDIYVHAKVAIVDDRLLRIGSSNLNNRSMGLDSECDIVIDAAIDGNHETPATIAQLRVQLLAEHLATEPATFIAEFERSGSLIETIEALRGAGKTLELLDLIKPGPLDTFIAENEVLDPESADGFLDPMSERGLRKRWHQGLRWTRSRIARRRAKRRGKK